MIIACCAHSTNSRSYADPVNNPEADEEFQLIDFSYQNLSALPDFIVENAAVVKHLVLDGNRLDENSIGEVRFPQLESLSFNCNQVSNIGVFIQQIAHKCPNLRFLSLIDNPGWPHPLRSNDTKLYKNYIKSVQKFFPKLRFLDSFELESRKLSTASTSSTISYSSSSSSTSD